MSERIVLFQLWEREDADEVAKSASSIEVEGVSIRSVFRTVGEFQIVIHMNVENGKGVATFIDEMILRHPYISYISELRVPQK